MERQDSQLRLVGIAIARTLPPPPTLFFVSKPLAARRQQRLAEPPSPPMSSASTANHTKVLMKYVFTVLPSLHSLFPPQNQILLVSRWTFIGLSILAWEESHQDKPHDTG